MKNHYFERKEGEGTVTGILSYNKKQKRYWPWDVWIYRVK